MLQDSLIITYMMSLASGGLSKLLCRAKFSVEHIALLLGASVLPIGTEPMSKGLLCELINQSLFRFQAAKQLLARLSPVNTSMLLTSSGDTLYSLKRGPLFLQPLEHNIHGFQPHSYRSVDGACFFLDKNTFLDSILGKVCIKIRLCFVQDFQFRSYNNCCRM